MVATLLRLLADQHIERKVTEWLRSHQSKHRVITAAECGRSDADDSELVEFATEDRRILLTKDKGFRSSKLYPICTHAGIIVCLPEPDTGDVTIDLLEKFLRSGKRKLSHHAIVTLHPTHFVVENQHSISRYDYKTRGRQPARH